MAWKARLCLAFAACLFLATAAASSESPLPLPSTPIQKLAFGSCNAHNRDQSIWQSIIDYKPELFVWLGDVVYADTPIFPLIWTSTPPELMKAKFEHQKQSPLYSTLRKQTPIVGVWDDHDYGKNNGGGEFHGKSASQTIFMDFVDEPADSPRRSQSGIYASYYLPGSSSDKDINLILLDVRFNRHGSMGEGDILGEEQWAWLEQTLKASPSKIHLIGSGIQVTPFLKPVQEAWSLHPASRQRLFNLVASLKVPGVIFLSGDVHYSEYLRVPASCSGTGYPVYEFTSSGLTHSCDGLLGQCSLILNNFFMTPYHFNNSFYTGLNWGSIEFDWTQNTITFLTHGLHGQVVQRAVIPIDSIQVPAQHSPNLDALSQCDGPSNYFLLIPFESYKYVLFLIPITIIYVAYKIVRLGLSLIKSSPRSSEKVKLRKVD